MNVVVFEDSACSRLAPANTCRPSYAVTCATYRLYDWICEFEGNKTGIIRPHLRAIQSLDFPALGDSPDPETHWTIFINARAVPSVANIARLIELIGDPADPGVPSLVATGNGTLSVARVETGLLQNVPVEDWPGEAAKLVERGLAQEVAEGLDLFNWPHDVIRQNMDCFEGNIAHRIDTGEYREISDNVFVAGTTQLGEYAITRTGPGPIVLEDNVTIGPYCFMRGPVYVGAGSRISEHASIKDFVSLGHTCRFGGEAEAVIVEPYSNKQHHGFLGHSYIGSWVNLGAGTCNSDLKNTYGKVNMQYVNPETGQTERVATGMQFVGCAIGDYSKSAINTSVFTGKLIGVCSMLYGYVSTNVPAFVNYARSLGQSTVMSAEVMIKTQERMFVRRNVPQRPADIQLINDVFQRTVAGREGLSDELPSF